MKNLVSLATLLVIQSSYAIRGDYLPESELPKNVCRIVIGNLKQIFQPSFQNGAADTRYKPVVLEQANQFVCSANLIAPDQVITAAHCFEGNNEWAVPKGRFPYPKLDTNGNRLPGCEGNGYIKKKECISSILYGTLRTDWVDTRLECPKEDGSGIETRPLKESMGYSNPFFKSEGEAKHQTSIAIGNFDIAYYKLETPITNIKPMEVEWDYEAIKKAIIPKSEEEQNPLKRIDLCRSFGYGLDNSDKAGVLRGANTPVTKLDPSFIEAKIERGYQLPNTGWVDHGDSGGALMCRQKSERKYKLYGVVSRGINLSDIQKIFESGQFSPDPEEIDDLLNTIASIKYTSPSYHKNFFDYLNLKADFPRSLDPHYWYKIMYPYQESMIESEIDVTRQCIKGVHKYVSRASAKAYKEEFKGLLKLLKKAKKETAMYPPFDPGLYLTKLGQYGILRVNRQIGWHCRQKVEIW